MIGHSRSVRYIERDSPRIMHVRSESPSKAEGPQGRRQTTRASVAVAGGLWNSDKIGSPTSLDAEVKPC